MWYMNSLGTMLPSVNKECPLLLQFLPGREVQLKKKKALYRLKVMLARRDLPRGPCPACCSEPACQHSRIWSAVAVQSENRP